MISFYTRALLLLRRPPCWNKHSAARAPQHVTSRLPRHVVLVVSCRDATSGIWAIAVVLSHTFLKVVPVFRQTLWLFASLIISL